MSEKKKGKAMNTSICPIDAGFDCRVTEHLVRIGNYPVDYLDAENVRRTIDRGAGIETIGETLARAGYLAVVGVTTSGRDVQCTPRQHAPVGDYPGYDWDGPAWAIQAKTDNYWCVRPSLVAAIEAAGWKVSEISTLE